MGQAGAVSGGWSGVASRAGRAVRLVYRRGLRIFTLAPVIPAIAVIPELIQHAVEIRLGMFGSLAAFRALSANAERLAYGNVKVAGLLVAALLAARFWACGRTLRGALTLRLAAVPRLLGAIALIAGVAFALSWVGARSPSPVALALSVLSFLAQSLLTVFVLAALFDDRANTVRRSVTHGWRIAIAITLLLAVAVVPAQLVHMGLHRLALGRPEALVWMLMTLDALVVGLLATLMGAALATGYGAAAED